MKYESYPEYTIDEMTEDDIVESTKMRLQSWLDTYPNDTYGVSREWVEERNARQRSPEVAAKRLQRFREGVQEGTSAAWVARDEVGNIIGMTTPFTDKDGSQHIGSLYVSKMWHGTGVGSALMQKVIEWFDSNKPITLGVVKYNERAKSFYRKWGFVEIPDSGELFDGKIPEIHMVRKGDNQ